MYNYVQGLQVKCILLLLSDEYFLSYCPKTGPKTGSDLTAVNQKYRVLGN